MRLYQSGWLSLGMAAFVVLTTLFWEVGQDIAAALSG